jgi:hypothetical protein
MRRHDRIDPPAPRSATAVRHRATLCGHSDRGVRVPEIAPRPAPRCRAPVAGARLRRYMLVPGVEIGNARIEGAAESGG